MRLAPLILSATWVVACGTRHDASVASASADTKTQSAASSAPTRASGFVIVDVPASSGDIATVVKSEVAKAKAKGLKPFVEFAAGWCEPCQAIKKSLDDPKMKAAFEGTYIIRLDADEWGEKLAGSGFSPRAIPVFYELTDDGKPTGRTVDGGAWEDNIPANMAPPLSAFFHRS